MHYHLSPGMSFCFIGAGAVVLDLKADRYYRLDSWHSAGLRALAVGEVDAHSEACASLLNKGIIRHGEGPPAAPVKAPLVCESAIEQRSATREPALSSFELFVSRFAAGQILSRLGLLPTVDYYRRRRDGYLNRRGGAQGKLTFAAAIAASFAEGRRFFPAKRRCVPDSLTLATILWRRGCEAQVFFGVRLDPFAAHCWVQQGNLLLSDPLDSVAEFSPVFEL
jgi:hypothetical protein